MERWKYQLDREGKALRRAIAGENLNDVLKSLLDCYNKIMEITGESDNPWITDAIEDIEFWLDGSEVDTGTVDDFLCNFYDTCDDLRVWLGI